MSIYIVLFESSSIYFNFTSFPTVIFRYQTRVLFRLLLFTSDGSVRTQSHSRWRLLVVYCDRVPEVQTQLHSLLDSAFEHTDHMQRWRLGGRKYQLRKLFREHYRQGAINCLTLGVDRAPEPGRPTSYLPWRLVPITFAASSLSIGAETSSA